MPPLPNFDLMFLKFVIEATWGDYFRNSQTDFFPDLWNLKFDKKIFLLKKAQFYFKAHQNIVQPFFGFIPPCCYFKQNSKEH